MPVWYPSLRVTGGVMALLLALTGCDKAVEGSKTAASITHKAYNDAANSWKDVFTYHAPAAPQGAQTGYCYQVQSDIVCYDSLQRQLTSKLVGYQDGDQISWVQPGGGSLGVSGGAPVALNAASAASTAPVSQESVSRVDVSQAGQISSSNLAPVK